MARIHRLEPFVPTTKPAEETLVEIRGEFFRIAPEIPGWVVLQLGALSGEGDATTQETVAAVREMVLGVIHPDDHGKWINLLRTSGMGAPEMMHWVSGIMELVSARPTEGSDHSLPSEPETLTSSTGGTAPAAEITGGSAL